MIIANASVLLFAAYRRDVVLEVALLATASAIALTAIDVIYVWRSVIPPVYLADAALELVFIAFWLVWFCRSSRSNAASTL